MIINNKYEITTIPHNVVLREKVINKSPKSKNYGKEHWDDIAYFSGVKPALNYILDLEIQNTEIKDIKSVLKAISDTERVIIKALKGVSDDYIGNL